MSQYDQLVRLREWELDEKRLELAEVRDAFQALLDKRQALEEELVREQSVASTSLEAAISYNAFANSVIRRREELDFAIQEKQAEVDAANDVMTQAFGELRKAEIVRDEFNEKERQKAARLEQMELDEIARNLYRRKPR